MPKLLSEDQISVALTDLDGWRSTADGLRRTIESPSFPAAIALVQQIAEAAERMHHHPDIDIRWRKVTYTCTTHSAGGVTDLDLRLAAEINRLASPS